MIALPDQGAAHWAACIAAIKQKNPNTTIEVLIPDFQGQTELIDQIIAQQPNLIAHNIETVERLTTQVRSAAKYRLSLTVLAYIAQSGIPAKSGFMLGLGETETEILQTMDDLRNASVSVLTLGQYLQPSRNHVSVSAYIHPDKFNEYKQIGLEKGFRVVESGPLVRSSYHAERHL